MSQSPSPVQHPCAWRGQEMTDPALWTRCLTPEQVAELMAATRWALEHGHHWSSMGRQDFPIDSVRTLLDEVADMLENGRGMAVIKGVPLRELDDLALRTLWVGIGSHLGTLRPQNMHGERMREIRDEGQDRGQHYGQITASDGVFLSSRARVASTGPLRYHTDRADAVGLLCVRQAMSGGINRIASAVAVHNEMLARRPDLAALLYQPYHRSRLGEESLDAADVYPLPVFAVRDGRFTSHYSRTFIEAAQRVPGVPAMSDAQWQALDLLAAIADELCLETRCAPGEIQLLNNHVIYHSRTGYEDGPDSSHKRLLYRLWLSMPNSRALPEDHRVLWGEVDAGAVRGGIMAHAAASR